jgi:phage antirepressor YoqD-like protein
MRRALDSEIERIGEAGENDSSNVLLIMDPPKRTVADGVLTENGLFLIQNSYKDYSIRQRLKLFHA